jgi:hypothetical protein
MQDITRRELLGMMGAAGLVRSSSASRPPNIIYIMADDRKERRRLADIGKTT